MAKNRRERMARSWMVLALAALLVAYLGSAALGQNYSAEYPITSISITNPEEDEVWLAGSDHVVTCTTGSDIDCDVVFWQKVDDSVTHYWTSDAGTFKNNDNIGTSVTYLCTNTAVSNSIIAHCNDDYAPDSNSALFDETETTDTETVSVIIPEVIEVNFQPASGAYNLKTHEGDATVSSTSVAEYVRTLGAEDPTTNEPAVFKKGTPIKLKFKASHDQDLTESSGVTVKAYPGAVDPGELGSQTFGTTWPCETGILTTGNLASTIKYIEDETYFRYKVPSGTDTYIFTAEPAVTNTFCVVADAPVAGPHYKWVAMASCRMADGQASDTTKTIMDDIFDSLATYARVDDWTTELNYAFQDTGGGSNVDSLLDDTSGSCGDWRQYFLALCNVQGLSSTDGLKSGNFHFDGTTQAYQPWTKFRVEHIGINNVWEPSEAADYDIVDDGEYPDPEENEVNAVEKEWWWDEGNAFHDHSVVFLDGATDYLYDPSFPPAGGSPVTVDYPGTSGYKTYDGTDNFMTNFFESSCPYLYGEIDVDYGDGDDVLHIYTDDFDNAGATPDDIKFKWAQF